MMTGGWEVVLREMVLGEMGDVDDVSDVSDVGVGVMGESDARVRMMRISRSLVTL